MSVWSHNRRKTKQIPRPEKQDSPAQRSVRAGTRKAISYQFSFDPKKHESYLLFLKKEADGKYAPVCGQNDPGLFSVLRLEGIANENITARNRFRRNIAPSLNGIGFRSMKNMSGISTPFHGLVQSGPGFPGRCPGLGWDCPFGAEVLGAWIIPVFPSANGALQFRRVEANRKRRRTRTAR